MTKKRVQVRAKLATGEDSEDDNDEFEVTEPPSQEDDGQGSYWNERNNNFWLDLLSGYA